MKVVFRQPESGEHRRVPVSSSAMTPARFTASANPGAQAT